MSDHEREAQAQQHLHEAMRAVLSDDHNYERGLAALREIVAKVAEDSGATGLDNLVVALSLELAAALEQIAGDLGVAAQDLVEVWFAD